MDVYSLKNNRMLCWDDFFIDKKENVNIIMHKPTKTSDRAVCDNDWDGNCNGYARFIKVGEKYYLYYRAAGSVTTRDGTKWKPAVLCLKVSSDGKHWRNVMINKHEYGHETFNSIIIDRKFDNFSVFYDENPNCPENEKYKALSMGGGTHPNYAEDNGPQGLYLFVSGNGTDFEPRGRLDIPGTFDSYNVMMWDKENEEYRFFYRTERRADDEEFDVEHKSTSVFRTVSTSVSKDFVHFEHYGELIYPEDTAKLQLYTNQIVKYYRASDMFIGFPTRYIERWDGLENYEYMPLAKRKKHVIEVSGREGAAVTDTAIMTSRDGLHFNLRNEAYMTPGIETRNNWWYGNNYTVYGIEETESDIDGAPNELSFYMGDAYHVKNTNFDRYAVRIDGFFSWYADYKGGEVLTRPFTFEGGSLTVNFATSAVSYMTVTVCDIDGNELEGYKSYKMFGDSLERQVDFEKPLEELEGKPIRLKFHLKDCHLYSFCFK